MFRYIKSSHEKVNVVYDNYLYLKDKDSDDKVMYKCEKFSQFECRARHHK